MRYLVIEQREDRRSGGCVLAVCSLLLPGLGQLLQGRFMVAVGHFVVATMLWLVWLGWAIHFYSAWEVQK